jgi:hypothetical protein
MDEDRFRTAVYRLCGRILRGEEGVFSGRELMRARADGDYTPGSTYNYRHAPIAMESVEILLRLMAKKGLLEEFRGENRTVYGDPARPPDNYYQLSAMLRAKLVRIARSSERERARLFGPVPEPPDESRRPRAEGPPSVAGVPIWPRTYEWGATRYSSPAPRPRTRIRPIWPDAGITALEHPIPPELRLIANGRYELLQVIGIGGMARVYRARDAATDTTVAIKILDMRELRSSESRPVQEMRERFEREAEIGKSLQIPGVARTLPWPERVAGSHEPDLSELPGSPQLRQVVREALRADPAERIPRAAVLEVVLLGTPELKPPAPEKDA